MSRLHWFALSSVSGIGGTTARRLIERFGSVEDVFAASDLALLEVSRVSESIVEGIRAADFESLERQMDDLTSSGVSLLTLDDDNYPANLRLAPDAPMLLYCAGDLQPDLDDAAVAVVGTREPSEEAAALALDISRRLAEVGVTVVSGLARGIDSAAHAGALAASGGRTIAVLGSGMNHIHPRENAEMAREIAERGAVLSELAPGVPPQGMHLMARDRIISGLSRAVVVIAADEKSGSMDTAAKAAKQGRAQFAVAGSPGCDLLLRRGAGLIGPACDGLEEVIAAARKPLEAAPPEPPPIQPTLF